MHPSTIMFIRHGEKPAEAHPPHGVNADGQHDAHSLSVRGWTRAGALAGLLARVPSQDHPQLVVPQRVLATKPSHDAKSHREVDTAEPVSRRLGLEIEQLHGHGDEAQVRDAILSQPQDALVVWHHGSLPELLRQFPVSNNVDIPDTWPEDRFDLIGLLRRDPSGDTYEFTVVNQALLDGDVETR